MAMDDHFEPWRKQGFICKPFAGDRGDGDRFVSEFLDAAAAKKADDDWTMDEVLLGQDGGGDAADAGHVVMYGNGPVAHSSRKIKVSAQSSTEAEICAGVAATKDIKFIRQILTFLKMTPNGPTPLLIDNEGMWFNVRNSGVTARTRHFESWQHFVRDAYENLVLTVHLIDTHSMIADILTKAMPKVLDYYKKFRDIIMDVVY